MRVKREVHFLCQQRVENASISIETGPIHDHTVICGIWSGHRKDLIGMSAEVANISKT